MNTGRLFLIAYLTITGHAVAQGNPQPLNAETFEYSASIIRQLPSTHDEMIKGCPKTGFLELSEAGLKELRQKSGLTRSALQERLCRDIIEGIASGEITYRTWRDWISTPDTERKINVSGK
ncbi:hypothetical protein [Rhizobium sp. NFR07]|uniref:hypothetical protein n=1 Tax=Rhizobium sp. NFR07 TaxID=1566262 RepID=UPI000B81752E|nr:hypothetical protein [Rhizobium sp. NFR07]